MMGYLADMEYHVMNTMRERMTLASKFFAAQSRSLSPARIIVFRGVLLYYFRR
jgi:hypothetical protein